MPYAYIFVVLAGALNAVQPGSNAQLSTSLGQPWLTALIVSMVTTAVFAVAFLATGGRLPAGGQVVSAPWWEWIGGLFGAAYVTGSLFFPVRMGAGIYLGLTVTAGIITSIAIDHFGVLGFQQYAASLLRLTGAALMLAGLALVARF